MILTEVLHFFKRYQVVPGSLYTGKHRAIRNIKPIHKERALRRLLLEKENMVLLSRPYLTREESFGHNVERNKEIYNKMKAYSYEKRWKPPVFMSEHVEHLNTTKKWE